MKDIAKLFVLGAIGVGAYYILSGGSANDQKDEPPHILGSGHPVMQMPNVPILDSMPTPTVKKDVQAKDQTQPIVYNIQFPKLPPIPMMPVIQSPPVEFPTKKEATTQPFDITYSPKTNARGQTIHLSRVQVMNVIKNLGLEKEIFKKGKTGTWTLHTPSGEKLHIISKKVNIKPIGALASSGAFIHHSISHHPHVSYPPTVHNVSHPVKKERRHSIISGLTFNTIMKAHTGGGL